MTAKEEMDSTTNRYVYNRTRKEYLEKNGEIHCTYCRYHKSENSTDKWYTPDKLPNWKLCSKNGKQWEKKPLKYVSWMSQWSGEIHTRVKW